MTRSPASIYNPHQAGWDEGYAAGLAAGAEGMQKAAAKEAEWNNIHEALSISERIRALPLPTAPATSKHWSDCPRDIPWSQWIEYGNQVPPWINPVTGERLEDAPASGEGADDLIDLRRPLAEANDTIAYFAAQSAARDAQIATLQQERDSNLRYATSFLVSFVREHCAYNPDWKPLPDLPGILHQLDNATTIIRVRNAEIAALRSENETFKLADDGFCRKTPQGESDFICVQTAPLRAEIATLQAALEEAKGPLEYAISRGESNYRYLGIVDKEMLRISKEVLAAIKQAKDSAS